MAFIKQYRPAFIAVFYYWALIFVIGMTLMLIDHASGGHRAVFYACNIVALWFWLDALYALFLGLRRWCWEHTAARDENGVLANAAPYTLEGESPREPRTAILFIHGFADTPETWQLLAPRVHALTGATCRVMRLPFISAPPRLQHRATLDAWLDAVRDEVARLRACHKKVFVAGHSLGGGLALLSSGSILLPSGQPREQDAPATLDGVILFAPLIHTPRWCGIPLSALFAIADRAMLFTRVLHNHFPAVIKTKDGRVYDYPRDRYIAFAIYRSLFKMTRRLGKNKTREQDAPATLAFLSLRDRVIDTPRALRYLAGAKIITTQEAGHVLTLDTGWEQRAEEIAAFISRA